MVQINEEYVLEGPSLTRPEELAEQVRDTFAAVSLVTPPNGLYHPLQTASDTKVYADQIRTRFPANPNYVSTWTDTDRQRADEQHVTEATIERDIINRKLGIDIG